MIFGSYPCCEGNLCFDVPDTSPAYIPEDCPHCGKPVWHKLSRVDPTSWVESDFLLEFDVDYEKFTVTAKENK